MHDGGAVSAVSPVSPVSADSADSADRSGDAVGALAKAVVEVLGAKVTKWLDKYGKTTDLSGSSQYAPTVRDILQQDQKYRLPSNKENQEFALLSKDVTAAKLATATETMLFHASTAVPWADAFDVTEYVRRGGASFFRRMEPQSDMGKSHFDMVAGGIGIDLTDVAESAAYRWLLDVAYTLQLVDRGIGTSKRTASGSGGSGGSGDHSGDQSMADDKLDGLVRFLSKSLARRAVARSLVEDLEDGKKHGKKHGEDGEDGEGGEGGEGAPLVLVHSYIDALPNSNAHETARLTRRADIVQLPRIVRPYG